MLRRTLLLGVAGVAAAGTILFRRHANCALDARELAALRFRTMKSGVDNTLMAQYERLSDFIAQLREAKTNAVSCISHTSHAPDMIEQCIVGDMQSNVRLPGNRLPDNVCVASFVFETPHASVFDNMDEWLCHKMNLPIGSPLATLFPENSLLIVWDPMSWIGPARLSQLEELVSKARAATSTLTIIVLTKNSRLR